MSNEPKRDTTPNNPTPNRQGLYAKAAKHAQDAIDVLVKEMHDGDNSNSRVGAAKALLAKAIPDLKAMELTGQLDTNVVFSQLSDEQLDKFINSKIGQNPIGGNVSGEGKATEIKSS